MKSKKEYAAEFARSGGKARAKALSPEQRKEIARKASKVRWGEKAVAAREANRAKKDRG